QFVEFDDGLNTAIQKIRQVLGDEARNPRFVETVPRQGYRFIAPVQYNRKHETSPAVEDIEPPLILPIRAESSQPSWPHARVALWVALLLAMGGVVLGWIVLWPKTAGAGQLLRVSITPPAGVELRSGIRGGSAISPDGKSIVFSGNRDSKVQ